MDANPLLNINSFSFKNLFWIQFNENRISLNSSLLPENVHLTLAYNSGSPDVNIHLSKNTSDSSTKPTIEILRISKTLLEVMVYNKMFVFLNNLIEPVNFEEAEVSQDKKPYYISQHDIQEDGEKIMLSSFKSNDCSIRKKKLSVTTNLEEKLMELASSEQLQALYEKKLKPSSECNNPFEVGMMVSEDKGTAVMRLFGKWYKLKDNHTARSVFKDIISDETLSNIFRHFKKSIVIIRDAKTNADTEMQNKKSIRLQRRPVRQLRLTLGSWGRNFCEL